MTTIPFEEFKKLDIRVAEVVAAEKVEGSDKLIKLKVDIGNEERQLVAGVAQFYAPEDMVGRRIVVIVNLEPKTFLGLESQGMLLAADDEGQPVLLEPHTPVPPGTKIR